MAQEAYRRRELLCLGAAGMAGLLSADWALRPREPGRLRDEFGPQPPADSLIPVVGDGKWIWTEPPAGQSGYLEPRRYEAYFGIELQGRGPCRQIKAVTTVPVELPEQRLEDVQVESRGGQAGLRRLSAEAGQLLFTAPALTSGQSIVASARFSLTLFKSYHGFAKERFPAKQQPPASFAGQFLGNSPGIETHARSVQKLAGEVAGQVEHPWDKAQAFHAWVWQNIEPRVQYYTNVVRALRDRIGDCEERAAIFVALCRAAGIPARLVWVPNHNWAEFYLRDLDGQGQWIPSHTSAYSWFGWTGAHEMVLQKGDRVHVPEKRQPQRLLADWMQWQGKKPKVRYFAELRPLADAPDSDPGPGARSKDPQGQWLVAGRHSLDSQLRDGQQVAARG